MFYGRVVVTAVGMIVVGVGVIEIGIRVKVVMFRIHVFNVSVSCIGVYNVAVRIRMRVCVRGIGVLIGVTRVTV